MTAYCKHPKLIRVAIRDLSEYREVWQCEECETTCEEIAEFNYMNNKMDAR